MSIIQTKLSNNSTLLIDVPDLPEILEEENEMGEYRDGKRAGKKVVESTKNLVNEAVNGIKDCAHELATGMERIEKAIRPDEIEASLSFKLTAEAGAVLTKIGGEAQLEVKLIWKNLNQ